jgi:hypothetical protein
MVLGLWQDFSAPSAIPAHATGHEPLSHIVEWAEQNNTAPPAIPAHVVVWACD